VERVRRPENCPEDVPSDQAACDRSVLGRPPSTAGRCAVCTVVRSARAARVTARPTRPFAPGRILLRTVAMHAALLGLLPNLIGGGDPPAGGAHRGPAAAPLPWWRSVGARDRRGGRPSRKARWFVVVFLSQDCPV